VFNKKIRGKSSLFFSCVIFIAFVILAGCSSSSSTTNSSNSTTTTDTTNANKELTIDEITNLKAENREEILIKGAKKEGTLN